MTHCRINSAFAAALLVSAVSPLYGQVCTKSQYANTLACLPGKANAGNTSWLELVNSSNTVVAYEPSTQASTAGAPVVPLGLGYQYASQVATAPSAATSAGYVFSFGANGLSAKPGDMGPLLSDLPATIGRNHVYVGTSYQSMQISRTGGHNINSFQYTQGFSDYYFYGWEPSTASASIKIQSVNTFVSYGVTGRLDIAAIIPWSRASMSFHTSCAAGAATLTDPNGVTTCFAAGSIGETYNNPSYPQYNGDAIYDVFYFYPSSESQTASGIGDVTVRAKYKISETYQRSWALGLEYRLPTGSPLNLQGSGATGIRPFLAWSYNGRVSPHVNLGYQYNGSSANDVRDTSITVNQTTGQFVFSGVPAKSKLPNIITASGGVDYALNRRLNLDGDILIRGFSNDGRQAFQASFPPAFGNSAFPAPQLFSGAKEKGTFVAGAKGRLVSRLYLSGNVMFDESAGGGMGYKPSPIVTASYDFGHSE